MIYRYFVRGLILDYANRKVQQPQGGARYDNIALGLRVCISSTSNTLSRLRKNCILAERRNAWKWLNHPAADSAA